MQKQETSTFPVPVPPLIVRVYNDSTATSEPVTPSSSNFGEFVQLGKFFCVKSQIRKGFRLQISY